MHAGSIAGLIAVAGLTLAAPATAENYGSFNIGTGFAPQTGTGVTGGSRDASGLGPECVGNIDTSPDHILDVTGTVDVRMYVESDVDATLVVQGPEGVLCDDDSRGDLDPEINAELVPGRYEIFVGQIGSSGGNYTLTLEENRHVPSTPERFRVAPGFRPLTGSGRVGGGVRAETLGADCVGLVSRQPNHIIDVRSEVYLRAYAQSDTDSTLVITGPGGTFCDDDSHGQMNPEINARLAPGRYELYVGRYRSGNDSYTLTLEESDGRSAAERQPGADSFTLGANFMPDPRVQSGRTGGPVDAASFGDACVGNIAEAPNHVIEVTSEVNLRMSVESDTDATLVVRGPGGTFCDDDSRGALDPEITRLLAPGSYEVFVGHLGEQPGEYTLSLSEDFSDPRDGVTANYAFTLGAGFTPDPQQGRGVTGGPMNAERFGEGCVGNIHTSPDHLLNITSAVDLHLYVDSTVDATLVVVGPNGSFCDDDSHGNLDPAIRERFEPGAYQVYIGHIGEGAGDYTLTITEDL